MKHLRILVTGSVMSLALLFMGIAQAGLETMATQQLTRAQVNSAGGHQEVRLPHQLTAAEFAPGGGLVTFNLQIDLANAPDQAVGIYVSKMALSGKLFVNGHLQSACGHGELEDLRCSHRPYLFETPSAYWKAGRNELQFDIYANARQSNGLSSVWVGDVETLKNRFYLWRYFLQVDVMKGLTWLSFLVGLLALSVGLILRRDSVYLWFGLTSVFNGLANYGIFADSTFFNTELFSWFVFATRLTSVSLGIITFATFFDKLKPIPRHLGLIYNVVCVTLIGLSANNRFLVLILYVPLLITGVVLVVSMIRWSFQSKKTNHFVSTAMMGLLLICSGYDWLKFKGETAFEGLYLLGYAYSGVLFLFGGMLLILLAYGLLETKKLSGHLEQRMNERTSELNTAFKQLLAAELKVSIAHERNRLLQDVHDGFGSQLVSAHMMVKQKQMTQVQLAELLQECIADLYLVISTLGNHENSLNDALADLGFRTQQRLLGTSVQLHCNFQLSNVPDVSKELVLHILRIHQEALNNALKHAGAANIWIEVLYAPATSQLACRISDDGVGLGQRQVQGRGISSMKTRARSIEATLTFSDRHPGTFIELLAHLK